MAVSASICIPTRARREYLAVALASVAPQAIARGAEIMVVEDDAADLETAALVERYGGRYVALGARRGLNVARNAAVEVSGGELICFLDDDVEVWPGWLEALLGAGSAYEVLGGPIRPRLEGSRLRACGREPLPITALDLGPDDRDAEFAWGANLALRRSAFERIGPFDERLSGAGDEEDWQRRLRAAGGRVRYVAAAGVDHRRAGADARLGALCRAAYHRGRAARRYEAFRGAASGLAGTPLGAAGAAPGVAGAPPGLAGTPSGVAGAPSGAVGAPRGVAGSPSGVAGAPSGVAGEPRGVAGTPSGVAAAPLGTAGMPPGLAGELRTLVGCLWHIVRRRCGVGVALTALTLGRLAEALDPAPAPPSASDPDYLSGRSGTLGRRAALIGAARDVRAGLQSLRGRVALGRAARRGPVRRVHVVGVARPEQLRTVARLRRELARSRHDIAVHLVPPAPGAGKWANVNASLAAYPPEADWLLIVDDDVVLPRGFLDRFLAVAEACGLELAQPAHAFGSHAAWEVTRRRPGVLARRTRFVEIGPVTALSARAAAELLPLPDLRMG
ncbi:MAG TPA: glycosyltransferase, partial [Solirubrobacter sp.]|nr:glycosyltransferase [Solirubrobacter sp.]